MKPVLDGRAKLLLILSLSLSGASVQSEETKSKPYVLPSYEGKNIHFKDPVPPIQPSAPINAENIFNAVIECYPSPSLFDISVKLQAGTGIFNQQALTDSLPDRSDYYVGIVAEMPLIDNSATVERERQREYERRTKTSALVAKFITALSKRNLAERELGLFTGLEHRAQIRVQMGVAGVTEQVSYLKEVIASRHKVTAATTEVVESRLALEGLCQDDRKEDLAGYLRYLQYHGGD